MLKILFFLIVVTLNSFPRPYYLTLTGTGAGYSWADAKSFSSMPWGSLAGGDEVFISGGRDGVIYNMAACTLSIRDVNNLNQVHIHGDYLNSDHNGPVTLNATGSYNFYIVNSDYIKFSNLKFRNAAISNIYITTIPYNNKSSNIIISECDLSTKPTVVDLEENGKCIFFNFAKACTVSTCTLFVYGETGITLDCTKDMHIENNIIITEGPNDIGDNSEWGYRHQMDCIKVGGLGTGDGVYSDETLTIVGNYLQNKSACADYDYNGNDILEDLGPGKNENGSHDDCIQFYTDIKAGSYQSVSGEKKYYYGSGKYQIVEIYRNYMEQASIDDPKNSGIIIGGCDDAFDVTPYSAQYLVDKFNINYQQGKMTKWYIWSNIIRHSEGTNLIDINNLDPEQIQIFNNTIYQAANTTDAGPVFIIYNIWNSSGNKLDGTTGTYSTLRNFNLRNNIFYSAAGTRLLKFGHYDSVKGIYAYLNFSTNDTINYNWYCNSGTNIVEKYNGTTATLYSFSSTTPKGWLNGTYDVNGGNSNPKFITNPPTQASHFALNTHHSNTSPCIDNGTTITISDLSDESKSYEDDIRGVDGPWDIGAYEVNLESWIPPRDIAIKGGLDAYPSPFNPTTNIKFVVPNDGQVSLIVYNILGKEVIKLVDEYKSAGEYNVTFNGEELSSGVYFYALNANGFSSIKKMILMK